MREQHIQKAVAGAIRKKRELLGVSQEKFADSIEMHRAYYSSIERGERNLTLRLLFRVSQGLKANNLVSLEITNLVRMRSVKSRLSRSRCSNPPMNESLVACDQRRSCFQIRCLHPNNEGKTPRCHIRLLAYWGIHA